MTHGTSDTLAYAGQTIEFVGRTFHAFDAGGASITMTHAGSVPATLSSVAVQDGAIVGGLRDVRGTLEVPAGAAIGQCWTVDFAGHVAGVPRRFRAGTVTILARPVAPLVAGARLVTFTVLAAGAPVPGATVRMVGAAPAVGHTDPSGMLKLGVDDGAYTVVVSKAGFDSLPPFALHVAADVAQTVNLAAPPSPAPSAPGTSVVRATVIRIDGTPIAGATIAYCLVDPPAGMIGVFDSRTMRSPPTDANGRTSLEVLTGSRVRFEYAGRDAIEIVTAAEHPLTLQGRQLS